MRPELSLPLLAMIVAILCGSGVVYRKFRSVRWSWRDGWVDGALVNRQTARFEISEIARIRDALGGAVADALMQQLAQRLTTELRLSQRPKIGPTSISISFFTADQNGAAIVRQRAIAALARKASVSGIEFYCSAKASIALNLTDNSTDLDDASLIPTAEQRRNKKLDLLRALPDAMGTGQITLEYQPKHDLRTTHVNSVEALLRWYNNDGSLAHTGDLIELVETTGAIRDITLWTLRQAIADGERLQREGHTITIFVNMSGGLLSDIEYCQLVLELIADTCCGIGIEITETAVINDPATAIDNLRQFALAGISVAIDDFGAGLSSLEYLQQLPACELKIDRAFIAKLSSSNRNPLIVKATIDLAHALEMKVTAEGVDDPLSIALLKVMGCDMAQGYLLSPPLPIADLTEYLARNKGPVQLAGLGAAIRKGIV